MCFWAAPAYILLTYPVSPTYKMLCDGSLPFPSPISPTHTKHPPVWRQDWGSPPSLKACFQCVIAVTYSVNKHPLNITTCCYGFTGLLAEYWALPSGLPKGVNFV